MNKMAMIDIEIKEDYIPTKNKFIEVYYGGVFDEVKGYIKVNKEKNGISKFVKTIKIYEPIVQVAEDRHIVFNNINIYYQVDIDGLVYLVNKDDI